MNQHSSTTQTKTTAQDHPAGGAEDNAGGPLRRSVSLYGCLVLAAVAGLLVGLFVGYAASDPSVERQPDLLSMSQCVADTLSLFGQKNPPTSETARDAREHCYSLIQSQGLLSDFAIRKLNFFQQYRANGVLMWMVVAVTFSGVMLAGFQLWASYQLAAANKTTLHTNNGELTLERNRLVLKSSITGLFILLISFCFFLVFVFYVYRFEPMADHNNSVLPPISTLPMGGLGAPSPEKGRP